MKDICGMCGEREAEQELCRTENHNDRWAVCCGAQSMLNDPTEMLSSRELATILTILDVMGRPGTVSEVEEKFAENMRTILSVKTSSENVVGDPAPEIH